MKVNESQYSKYAPRLRPLDLLEDFNGSGTGRRKVIRGEGQSAPSPDIHSILMRDPHLPNRIKLRDS